MKRSGFTLLEVALFLGITGLLFVGIVLGTQNSIAGQRYADSVQGFAEFLRSIYSEVSNPQSAGEGRSETAIYGKMISFGQSMALDGSSLKNDKGEYIEQRIYVYDVVGKVADSTSTNGKASEILKSLNANVIVKKYRIDGKTVEQVEPAGLVQTYVPRWSATIETTALKPYAPFTGTILIVRHPKSGTINTIVSSDIVEVNKAVLEANAAYSVDGYYDIDTLLTSKLGDFDTEEVNFCIDAENLEYIYADKSGGLRERRNIRLVRNARNASGVEVIDMNDYDESDDGVRNECMPENYRS